VHAMIAVGHEALKSGSEAVTFGFSPGMLVK
jgi:hypothetical protein